MRSGALAGAVEALGAVFVVAGLAFWSLPIALTLCGLFLIVAAAAPEPGRRPGGTSSAGPAARTARRAGTRAS